MLFFLLAYVEGELGLRETPSDGVVQALSQYKDEIDPKRNIEQKGIDV